jgi:hypothetical protein
VGEGNIGEKSLVAINRVMISIVSLSLDRFLYPP